MTGRDVVEKAREFIGCRYRHQGRTREGMDCIGLPVLVRRELGMPALDATAYGTRSTGTEMLDYCRAHMREISKEDLQPGDLIVQMNGAVRHMAIVADYAGGGLSIVHAWAPNRRVVECRLDDTFMADVRGCFRFREIS